MTLTELDVQITKHCSRVTVRSALSDSQWTVEAHIFDKGDVSFVGPSVYSVLSELCANLRGIGKEPKGL